MAKRLVTNPPGWFNRRFSHPFSAMMAVLCVIWTVSALYAVFALKLPPKNPPWDQGLLISTDGYFRTIFRNDVLEKHFEAKKIDFVKTRIQQQSLAAQADALRDRKVLLTRANE